MPDLLTELKDRVLYLTMNRPDKLNAMSAEMMGAMVDNLARAATNPEVGAVVLTGAGRGFCAGGDITAMRDRNEGTGAGAGTETTIEDRVASLRRGEEASLMLHQMPKVTIAAINGPAAGAGLSIAMACDIRIASDAARFGTAFAKVGFSGDYGGTWSLTRFTFWATLSRLKKRSESDSRIGSCRRSHSRTRCMRSRHESRMGRRSPTAT